MRHTWQPLLEGELADRARRAVSDIAEDIEPPTGPVPPPAFPSWSLAGGDAGTALFYAYLSEARADAGAHERACGYLESALQGVAERPMGMGLWEGLMGVAWTYDHLESRIFEAEDDGEVEEESDADLFLDSFLRHDENAEVYDLITGLAGHGVACLEGLPRPGARRALDRVLDHLLRTAEPMEGGLTWYTPPEQLSDWQRRAAPEGYYNCGLAHGVPAVVPLLASCIRAGIREDELEPLLEGSLTWLRAQRGRAGFPSWVPKGRPRLEGARLAWCYGDPGVACALLTAGRTLERTDWQGEAEEVAVAAARRETDEESVRDCGICHGAAGLGHLWNRLYQGTGNAELASASRYWFSRALDMREPGRGYGGYQAWSYPRGQIGVGDPRWVDDPGLLTGSAGVGLCLLAAVEPQEPEWDRSLMISAA